jgi:uncharacterized protein
MPTRVRVARTEDIVPSEIFANKELLHAVRSQFVLDWKGIHGVPHWVRVRENGLLLARRTGARPDVVELFALFHDSRRLNDGHDPGHGERGAAFAKSMAGSLFDLDPRGLQLLMEACRGHSDGLTEGDITVLTCWDADRLDLGRIGIQPDPARLCTEAAREPGMLERAIRRSRQ